MERYIRLGDNNYHVLDVEGLAAYGFDQAWANANLYPLGDGIYISNHFTRGDMANAVLRDKAYDYGTPMAFWYTREDWQECVWVYEDSDHFGKPYNIVQAFNAAIRQAG